MVFSRRIVQIITENKTNYIELAYLLDRHPDDILRFMAGKLKPTENDIILLSMLYKKKPIWFFVSDDMLRD